MTEHKFQGQQASERQLSIPGLQAEAFLNQVYGSFIRFSRQTFDPDGVRAKRVFEIIHMFVREYVELTGKSIVTEFDPRIFGEVLERMEDTFVFREDDLSVAKCMDAYLHFLCMKHLRTGTVANFNLVHALVSDDGKTQLAKSLGVKLEVSDAEALQFFDELPLLRCVRGLLTWIGSGRDLKLDVGGDNQDAVAFLLLLGQALRATRSEPVNEAKNLSLIWDSMLDQELIIQQGSRTVQTQRAELFLNTDMSSDRRALIDELLGAFFWNFAVWAIDHHAERSPRVSNKFLRILSLAPYGLPHEVFSQEELESSEQKLAVHEMLEELSGLGLVDIGTHYSSQPALRVGIDRVPTPQRQLGA